MLFLHIIYGLAILTLGTLTSISDFRNGKIYNKTLAAFLGLAIILDIVYYGFFANDLLKPALFNIVILVVFSLVMFYSHIFAGGDCKLLIVLSILYPAEFYWLYGNSPATLLFAPGFAILLGYVYLLVSSALNIVRGKTRITGKYILGQVKAFVYSFLTITIYICAINLILCFLERHGIFINVWIVRIICFGVSWIVGRFGFLRKWFVILPLLLFDIVLAVLLRIVPISLNPENYYLALILLLAQMTIKTNLYDTVSVQNLKPGMILSAISSAMMQGSRVRGLPGLSSEDLRNRLTVEEVESIHRWAESRHVEELTIVKKIPFAFFISLGFICYFIIWGLIQ